MTAKTIALTFLLCLSVGYANPQAANNPPPEEPDFFFLTGGPYTQQKHSPQVISAIRWLNSKTEDWTVHALSAAGRVEFGVTDYLEADFEFGATRIREDSLGLIQLDTRLDGMMLGARYRILREDFAPITLTVGPQFLIPNRTARPGETGYGYGLDVTAAKDWGGPVFGATSLNWRNTPGIRPNPEGASSGLQILSYACALGLRPLEAVTRNDTKHDLHVFAEFLSTREDEVAAGAISRSTNRFLAPGIRYGFLNKQGILAEIGAGFPVGLNRDAPDWGAFLQLQLEVPTLF